jgi:hypothetical protein
MFLRKIRVFCHWRIDCKEDLGRGREGGVAQKNRKER